MRALARPTEFDAGTLGQDGALSFSSVRAGRRWRLLACCGSGGTAEVWHVAAPDGREAALKRLKPELRSRPDLGSCLHAEFALLRAVASPALVAPLELVDGTDGPALVLEYLPNGDLVSLLGAPARHWLPTVRAVLSGVRALHAHGVAHGDVKARNVLFARDHSARLIDLTAARPADGPAGLGTAAYALPGDARATAVDGDCFAFAALLYELATARLPFGEGGARHGGALVAAPPPADSQAARIAAAARHVLEAGGRLPQGLSYLADVIESVGASGA